MVRVTLRRPHHEYLPGKQDDITRKEEGPLELQVVDNGTGLTDILGSLALFSSTKSGKKNTLLVLSSAALAGKYGLGLTLSLLYSQVHFGGVVKITSAAEDSLHWSLMKCRVDPGTGEPITEFSKTGDKPKGFRSGSDIRLWVPGSMKALAYAKPRLEVLFRRMKLTADRAAGVNFICEGCLDELSISVSHGGSENSPQLLEDNLDLVRSFSSGLTAMLREEADNDCRKDLATDLLHIDGHAMPPKQVPSTLQSNITIQPVLILVSRNPKGGKAGMYVQVAVALQRTLRGVGSVQGGREGREALTTIPVSHLFCYVALNIISVLYCVKGSESSLLLALTIPIYRPHMPHGLSHGVSQAPGLAPPSSPAPASVPLFLSRFVNRVPMLDTPTSSACALCAGVAGAPWRRLGLSLSSSKIREEEGRLRFILSETPTPLKVFGFFAWSALEGIEAVHISVGVEAESVPFSSLRKDAITHTEARHPP
ncbi:unnamed protein product [Discosporangium mesarthrocarpum]